jgi:hypothetical protein
LVLEDAINQGYKVGVVANSDGHKGRPGASHPGASTFGAYGGLTCVLAESLTREALFDAIKARRCYGVTGAQRIHVELAVNGLPMGAAPAGGVDLRVFMRRLPVHGHTSELKFEHTDPSPMRGRCHPYWICVTQEDGAQAWTSPVYLDL